MLCSYGSVVFVGCMSLCGATHHRNTHTHTHTHHTHTPHLLLPHAPSLPGTYHGKLGISVAVMSFSQGILGTVLFGKCGMGPCSRNTPNCCQLEPMFSLSLSRCVYVCVWNDFMLRLT